ncbi:MAG: WYL domain-containing protein [Oscillospiraceae bacterium]|nr:WYL domain-containing protein [Oscillospiraceae bacterium]
MDGFEPKKLALLRVLQIFQKHSDSLHPLKQEDIVKYLDIDYGISMERKAVSRNISLLREAGFDIESSRFGSYLNTRYFTDAELHILIDGVLSSKHITHKYSRDLIEKLCTLTSKYFRSHVRYIYSLDQWDKSDNPALFYNIDIIDEAIEKKKQITFAYNKYGADKKLHKTHSHRVSPYQLILHNQRYYLMGRNEYKQNIGYYRLDRITDIALTDEKIVPVTSVEGYEKGISFKELSTALPYMYNDKPERVDFIAKENVIDQVIDWFGKDIRISRYDEGTLLVSVRVSLMAMEHWAIQYAGNIIVISPQPLVAKIRTRLQQAADDYNKTDADNISEESTEK